MTTKKIWFEIHLVKSNSTIMRAILQFTKKNPAVKFLTQLKPVLAYPLILASLLGCLNVKAQQDIQSAVMQQWFAMHPELKSSFDQYQGGSAVKPSKLSTNNSVQAAPVYTIPVVFHILHLGGIENISDAQVNDAVSILNRDFQKQNADTINIVPSFTNNIANVQFQFKLATIDPNGNCTNGIIRHYTSRAAWVAGDFSYFAYTWPSNKYLNFYIVKNMSIPGGSAYTYFPGSGVPASADAIIALHSVCGSIGTSNVNNSRWLTQKVGHWFNLQHTWGLNNTLPTVCGDDGVADTPITKGFLTCNLTNANVCNAAIVENVQNFMDGSPCQSMFTNGQKTRMHNCINSAVNGRNNLSSPGNLLATGITSGTTNCIPLLDIAVLPSNTLCAGTPLTLHSYTSNATVSSYSWTANNGAAISNPTLASITVTPGTTGFCTITCVATNSNGSATASLTVFALSSVPNVIATNIESFENPLLPPNWVVQNPNTPASLWSLSNLAGSHGNQCMMVNGESASAGALELLNSPSYDFANNPGSQFTFKYAYARQTYTHTDVFKVQASKDCGGTWKDIYVPAVSALASGSGETSTILFIPTVPQWKSYNLTNHPNFTSFLSESNVLIRFYFREDTVSGNGNRFYLDQVNFEVVSGINELTRAIELKLYPNPSVSEAWLSFVLSDSKQVSYSVTDIKGAVLFEQTEKSFGAGRHSLLINQTNELKPGVYFVNLNLDGIKLVKKLMIE